MYHTVKLVKGAIAQQYTQWLTAKARAELIKKLNLQVAREPGLVYSIELFEPKKA